MIQLLAPLLGGIGGMLFPSLGAGAAATGIGALLSKAAMPALGAGLGTLLTGGDGKDAIRNALLMGAGTAVFPGAVSGIQQSGFGQGITKGLGSLFGLEPPIQGTPGPAKPSLAPTTATTRPQPRPDALPQMAEGLSGMEMEARRPPMSLPSVMEMAALDRKRSSDQAAAGFDLAQSFPLDPGSMDVMPEYNMVRPEGLEVPRNMVRPEADIGTPFNMARPEGTIEYQPGMTMRDDAREEAFRRLYATKPRTPEAMRRAREAAIFSRQPPANFGDMLTYDRSLGFAEGGEIAGPGTGKSDSIPAVIHQNGKPVRRAALSDGEFVMTADAVRGAGGGSREKGINRMYELMRRFESGEMA